MQFAGKKKHAKVGASRFHSALTTTTRAVQVIDPVGNASEPCCAKDATEGSACSKITQTS